MSSIIRKNLIKFSERTSSHIPSSQNSGEQNWSVPRKRQSGKSRTSKKHNSSRSDYDHFEDSRVLPISRNSKKCKNEAQVDHIQTIVEKLSNEGKYIAPFFVPAFFFFCIQMHYLLSYSYMFKNLMENKAAHKYWPFEQLIEFFKIHGPKKIFLINEMPFTMYDMLLYFTKNFDPSTNKKFSQKTKDWYSKDHLIYLKKITGLEWKEEHYERLQKDLIFAKSRNPQNTKVQTVKHTDDKVQTVDQKTIQVEYVQVNGKTQVQIVHIERTVQNLMAQSLEKVNDQIAPVFEMAQNEYAEFDGSNQNYNYQANKNAEEQFDQVGGTFQNDFDNMTHGNGYPHDNFDGFAEDNFNFLGQGHGPAQDQFFLFGDDQSENDQFSGHQLQDVQHMNFFDVLNDELVRNYPPSPIKQNVLSAEGPSISDFKSLNFQIENGYLETSD